MPEPLQGLVAVAEFGSKFEADAAVASLQRAGVDAIPSYDPALNSVAPFFASDRTFEVLVRQEDVDRASTVLEVRTVDLPTEFTGPGSSSAGRSTVRTRARGCMIAAMVATLVLMVVLAALFAGR